MTHQTEQKAERKRTRRTLESGYSLLSRGEPQIWLIGGMLVVCLMMITSLLALILYRGLPAFWPKQVDWLVLNDGSQEIGQPQYRQAGLLSIGEEQAVDLDLVDVSGEDAQPEEQPKMVVDADVYSSYYRTGNYRLSNEHYRWLDTRQVSAAGTATVDDAVVVERLEWGRFYGIPVQSFENILPAESALGHVDQLERLNMAFAAAANAEQADSDKLALISQSIQSAATDIRQRAIAAAVVERAAELQPSELIQSRASEGEAWILIEDTGNTLVNSARIASTDASKLASGMQQSIQRAQKLRSEMKDLRFSVSRLDAEIAKLRIGVRQAEIDSEVDSLVQAESSHYTVEQIVNLEQYAQYTRDAAGWLSEVLATSVDGAETIDGLDATLNSLSSDVIPALIKEQETALEGWLAGAAKQPKPIQRALRNYTDGYRDAYEKKLPLQLKIEQLERQAARDSFAFCVPNGSTLIADTAESDLQALITGTVTPTMGVKLTEAGIEPPQGRTCEPTQLCDALTMVRYVDSSGQQHAMSVVSSGYIDGTPQLQLHDLTLESLSAEEIVRLVQVNEITTAGKIGVYLDRWGEFLFDEPREANSEGGVFPAIWGTIVMTLIMTIAVVPFGVMAALYLREYAGGGPLVSLIRISINNLAGVPSIVYGVFGFSFFCYTIGAYIDGGAKNADITPWPSYVWFVWMALCAIVGTCAFLASFASSGPTGNASRSKKMIARAALVLWLACLAIMAALILKSPFFDGFYQAQLPNPTFGKGGLLWAALTLALLTLPVVIVATEEALAAVPNSLREGSLACGASKWQTIRRIILPHARPGILTGAILAMARGAGEVAPLMLVGALPSAPDLPLDGEFPFFHGSRSFMHLGYQIYTLGFQSQNSDAAVPMVFTCTLLLIAIVAALNIFAILLRARLKKRFAGNQF